MPKTYLCLKFIDASFNYLQSFQFSKSFILKTLFLVSLALVSSAHALDWPFFKADAARSGTTTDTVLGPGLELKWMGKAGDAGIVSYSSPIVVGDQAFISHSNGLVTAFDLSPNFAVQSDSSALPTFYVPTKSAAQDWQFRTNGSVYSSPAFAVSSFVRRVFVGTTSGTVYALKANTALPQGEQLWRVDLGGAFFASPIVGDVTGVGPTVFVAAVTGDVYALNAMDGSLRWKIAMPGQVLASPVFDTPKQRLYLVDMRGNIRAVEAGSGGGVWGLSLLDSFHASPALQGDVLYVVGRNGTVRAVDASAQNYPAARIVFSTLTLPAGIASSPAVTVYSGKPRLLVLTHDGTLRAIDANVGGTGLTSAWTLAPKVLDAGGTASVSIAGTRSYVGTQDGALRMIDVADGVVRFEQKLAGGAEIAPAVAQSSLLVASNDGALRTYGMPISSIRVTGQSPVQAGRPNIFTFEAIDAAGNVVPTAAGSVTVTSSIVPGQSQLQVVVPRPLDAGRGTVTLARSPGNYLIKVSVVVAGKTYTGALTVQFVSVLPTPTPMPSPVCNFETNQSATFVLGQPDMTSRGHYILGDTHFNGPADLTADGQNLFVSDYDNARIMIFPLPLSQNAQPASYVVGKANFLDPASSSTVSASNLRFVEGAFSDGQHLYACDPYADRVLIFNLPITQNGPSASLVLGQADFSSSVGGPMAADNFDNPNGIFGDGHQLFVADTRHNRVLVFNLPITQNKQAADYVIGSPSFSSPDIGIGATANNLYAPVSAYSDGQQLYISDSGNNRVLIYNLPITQNGPAAIGVIGQPDFVSNVTSVFASATNMGRPWQVSGDGEHLFVTDWQRSRVLAYKLPIVGYGPAADVVIGQADFAGSQVNQGTLTTGANTLGTPYGVMSDGTNLYAGDYKQPGLALSVPAQPSSGEHAYGRACHRKSWRHDRHRVLSSKCG